MYLLVSKYNSWRSHGADGKYVYRLFSVGFSFNVWTMQWPLCYCILCVVCFMPLYMSMSRNLWIMPLWLGMSECKCVMVAASCHKHHSPVGQLVSHSRLLCRMTTLDSCVAGQAAGGPCSQPHCCVWQFAEESAVWPYSCCIISPSAKGLCKCFHTSTEAGLADLQAEGVWLRGCK